MLGVEAEVQMPFANIVYYNQTRTDAEKRA